MTALWYNADIARKAKTNRQKEKELIIQINSFAQGVTNLVTSYYANPLLVKKGKQMNTNIPIFSKGWGLMPNTVLFDNELSPTARLVLCYISSLCGESGTCRPRNKTIAEKFNLKPRQVTNILADLSGYIYAYNDERGRRVLSLTPDMTGVEGGSKKLLGGTQKIAIHSNNNSNDSFSEETIKQIRKIHQRYVQLFKVDSDAWHHATTDERRELLLAALQRYKLTDSRKKKVAVRLKDAGFEMIMRALENANKNPWNHGENDSSWKMDLYVYLLRNYEMVERWADQEGGAE